MQKALSKFAMPAMSPTMTEGGIATWKKKEGESFAPGDVLLEIVGLLVSRIGFYICCHLTSLIMHLYSTLSPFILLDRN